MEFYLKTEIAKYLNLFASHPTVPGLAGTQKLSTMSSEGGQKFCDLRLSDTATRSEFERQNKPSPNYPTRAIIELKVIMSGRESNPGP